LKLYLSIFGLVLLFAPLASAQELNDLQLRLKLFENAQSACKATVLSNAEAAVSFVRSGSGSLTENCECAALLAVSKKSNAELRSILFSSDAKHSIEFSTDVKNYFFTMRSI
jgi:hypothetical protein